MKVQVKIRFNDKETSEFYKLNQILEISEMRYEEIKKYVEIVENNNTFEEIAKKSYRRKGKGCR